MLREEETLVDDLRSLNWTDDETESKRAEVQWVERGVG